MTAVDGLAQLSWSLALAHDLARERRRPSLLLGVWGGGGRWTDTHTCAHHSLDLAAPLPSLRPVPSLSSTRSHQNRHFSTSPSVILTTVAGTPGVDLPAPPMRSSLPSPNIMTRPHSSPSDRPLRRSWPGARAVSPTRGLLKRGQKGVEAADDDDVGEAEAEEGWIP